MTTEEQVSTEVTSPEDRFFGIKTNPIADDPKEGEKEPETKIEIIDDRPEEDQRPAKKEVSVEKTVEKEGDDDLEGYSEKVKKRINKLVYEQHEERRQREASDKMRDEAVRVAQQLNSQNIQQQDIINSGEARLVEQFKTSANRAAQAATAAYKEAYEAGDTDAIIKAQEAQIAAQAEQRESLRYDDDYKRRSGQYVQQRQQRVQQAQQQAQQQQQQAAAEAQQRIEWVKPTDKAAKWAKNNQWFGNDLHKDMTALAYGVHEDLVRNKGMQPDSDEYFEAIDTQMRTRFPEYYQEPAKEKPRTVVASASRSNSGTTRKVRLTQTQVALAKKLGITVEQYAKQLTKEM